MKIEYLFIRLLIFSLDMGDVLIHNAVIDKSVLAEAMQEKDDDETDVAAKQEIIALLDNYSRKYNILFGRGPFYRPSKVRCLNKLLTAFLHHLFGCFITGSSKAMNPLPCMDNQNI